MFTYQPGAVQAPLESNTGAYFGAIGKRPFPRPIPHVETEKAIGYFICGFGVDLILLLTFDGVNASYEEPYQKNKCIFHGVKLYHSPDIPYFFNKRQDSFNYPLALHFFLLHFLFHGRLLTAPRQFRNQRPLVVEKLYMRLAGGVHKNIEPGFASCIIDEQAGVLVMYLTDDQAVTPKIP